METKLQNFLIDDLKKVEYHIQELIKSIKAKSYNNLYEKDIEEIEQFFSYWKQHAQIKTK
jgi:hypothetical protein